VSNESGAGRLPERPFACLPQQLTAGRNYRRSETLASSAATSESCQGDEPSGQNI